MTAQPTNHGRLHGKVALITGSDSGIGQATAIEMAKEGADVVVHYHSDRDGAEETREHVEAAGRVATLVQADLSEEEGVEGLFDAALDGFDHIDILVNNAGIDASGTPVAELSTEVWDRALRTNLYAPFWACRRFINLQRQGKGNGGRIINVTSIHQEVPRAGASDYDVSKGGLRNLTTTLALELAEEGITVNNLAPGMVLTPFNEAAKEDEEVREQQVQSIPMKRAAEPEEIGKLAVFLASDDAAYVTGATYVMDGGLMQNQGQGA
jgi:glucose 1-dehydrogenase